MTQINVDFIKDNLHFQNDTVRVNFTCIKTYATANSNYSVYSRWYEKINVVDLPVTIAGFEASANVDVASLMDAVVECTVEICGTFKNQIDILGAINDSNLDTIDAVV